MQSPGQDNKAISLYLNDLKDLLSSIKEQNSTTTKLQQEVEQSLLQLVVPVEPLPAKELSNSSNTAQSSQSSDSNYIVII